MGSTKVKNDVKEERTKEEKKEKIKHKSEKPVDIKSIVRVAATDLDGEKPVIRAIQKIKGIKYSMSNAICKAACIDPNKKLGSLTEAELEKLESVIKDPIKFNIPPFLFNRRRDPQTGKDIHLTGSDLTVANKLDIQRYIDLKTYRGWRHMLGQPVRGQRTRSSFRARGRAVGVMRKEIKLQVKKSEEKK